MKVLDIINESKTQKAEAPKPRNFVAKNAINTGAGAHKDKKKAAKQGDVKHKSKQFAESQIDELSKGTLRNYSDKADMDIVKKHRVRGPQAQAGDKAAVAKTDKKINKRMAGIDRAVSRLNKESIDSPEYNDEAGMAEGSLYTIQRAAEGLIDVIENQDNLPEWCQEKISLAEDYLVTVWDYIQSEKAQGVDPQVAESQVDEISLGDYRKKAAMQKAQSQMGAMFARDPEQKAKDLSTFQKREKGLNRLKARDEKSRKAEQDKQLADLVNKLPQLKAEYEQMKAKYKSLGGSNWQYADREQNLSASEREARSMEGPMNNLWRQISAAEKAQKQGMGESATAGSTSAGNMAVGAVYPNKKGKTFKNKNGTVKNALDVKGVNLMTGGSIKR